jgi:heptosyltransferase II
MKATPIPRRILVVAPAWVGDMVMAESLFQSLHRQYPEAILDVLAPRWTLPLIRFMPEVSGGIALPLGHGELGLAERYRIGRDLRAKGYDLALVLPGSLKSALVPFFAGVGARRGFGGALRRLLLTEALAKPSLPQVETFLALAPDGGEVLEPRLIVTDEQRAGTLAALGLQAPRARLLAIAPGAEYGPAKRWPTRHFAALAAAKRAQGWQVWVFGSPGDRDAATEIPAEENLAGRTSLDQAVALLSLADAVVSNDSGLMHVAAALGRPQVALFGPSDPLRTGPHNAKAHVLRLGIECSPCNKRICPLGHHRCLEDLNPAQVLALLPVA